MAKSTWHYEEEPLNGGAGGEVFRSIFNGSGADAATRLAREAIQNSVDASAPGKMALVTLQLHSYSGEQRAALWQAAGLEVFAKRKEVIGLHKQNVLADSDEPLRVLHVVDANTTGLSGDPEKSSSKLRKLLMEIGGSQKLDAQTGTGGSYGFGKAVYSASSRIAVIFAYSRTTDDAGAELSLLMGCAYHKAHSFEGRATTGRAFFAKATKVSSGTRYDAFKNEEADLLAARLGMQRPGNELGTTVAIFDCPISADDVRIGVEKSWWPKIERDNFKVKIIGEDGKPLHARPRLDPSIRPFIEAMNVALGSSPEMKGKSAQHKFNKVEGLSLGTLGLFVMPSQPDVGEETDIELDHRDTIALVRSPGMVVQYYGKRQVNHPPVAGVFLASEEIDPILRRSEPPEHDRWDPKADRLDPSGNEREIVETVHKRIWNELRAFQRRARPSDPAGPSNFAQLERELAQLFGPSAKRSPVGPGAKATPISLEPAVHIEADGDALKMKGRVTVGLKADHDGTLNVRIDLKLNAIDEAGRHSEAVPVTAEVESGKGVLLDDGGWQISLEPGEKVRIDVTSASYDREWTVDFVPSVRPLILEEVQ